MAELPRGIDSISFGFDLVSNCFIAHEIESSKIFARAIEWYGTYIDL